MLGFGGFDTDQVTLTQLKCPNSSKARYSRRESCVMLVCHWPSAKNRRAALSNHSCLAILIWNPADPSTSKSNGQMMLEGLERCRCQKLSMISPMHPKLPRMAPTPIIIQSPRRRRSRNSQSHCWRRRETEMVQSLHSTLHYQIRKCPSWDLF